MTDEPDSLDENVGESLDEHLDRLADHHDRERRAIARCPHCGSYNIRRSHSAGMVDKLMRLIGRRAYRCRDCRDRFHATRSMMDR
jgi:uncharacterized protein with PIN domain